MYAPQKCTRVAHIVTQELGAKCTCQVHMLVRAPETYGQQEGLQPFQAETSLLVVLQLYRHILCSTYLYGIVYTTDPKP